MDYSSHVIFTPHRTHEIVGTQNQKIEVKKDSSSIKKSQIDTAGWSLETRNLARSYANNLPASLKLEDFNTAQMDRGS